MHGDRSGTEDKYKRIRMELRVGIRKRERKLKRKSIRAWGSSCRRGTSWYCESRDGVGHKVP